MLSRIASNCCALPATSVASCCANPSIWLFCTVATLVSCAASVC